MLGSIEEQRIKQEDLATIAKEKISKSSSVPNEFGMKKNLRQPKTFEELDNPEEFFTIQQQDAEQMIKDNSFKMLNKALKNFK